MPEGPEIRRAADNIAAAIVDQPAKEVFFAFDHLKSFKSTLTGQTVTSVESRGKAILTRFENGLNIYSHNQLYGRWMIRSAYNFPDTNRQLRLAIHTQKKSALLYSASEIEVLADDELDDHHFLSKLGPDLLSDSLSVDAVARRFKEEQFRRRRLYTLLLDQEFLAGLGNYLRSEVLYVAGVHPSKRPVDCTDSRIQDLAQAALDLTRQSYETGGITNDLALVEELKAERASRREYRFRVFNRDEEPCFNCGTLIIKDELGGRRCYFCPECQPADG